jgi:hypothetical protein
LVQCVFRPCAELAEFRHSNFQFFDPSEYYLLHTPLGDPSDLILSGFLLFVKSTVKVIQLKNIAKHEGWYVSFFFSFLVWGETECTWYVGH